jgi:hypothetical protein
MPLGYADTFRTEVNQLKLADINLEATRETDNIAIKH